uniref:Heat shock factor binding protein 1 n=1 Tax=Plectus sambesii TaxID=2011161 RepID=A0A914UX13_9BILA
MDSGTTVTKAEPNDGVNADSTMNVSGGDLSMNGTDANSLQELTGLIQGVLQQTQDRFQNMSDQIIRRIDDMTKRIDDLERNITDLMTQAGVDQPEP